MKKQGLGKSAMPAAVCAGLCLTGTAYAQVTPAQINQFKDFIGNRAEVGIVLGASESASGGNYTVDGRRGNDDFDFSLFKFGGSAELGDARPLGNSGVMWNPYVFGTIGYISGDNDIDAGPLAGNDFEESALGINFGGGVAFHLTDRFTVTPYVGVIYGHYEAEVDAKTAAGQAVDDFLQDNTLDSIGATPGIGLAYKLPIGRNTLTLGASYTFFGTTDISDSDLEADGSSHILEQRVDADVPLNAHLWGCRLHTGGYVSLTEAFGDISDTMSSDVWATIHPRILLDTTGKLWKMERIGLGASYMKGEHFDGWSIGVDVSFKF
jgi:hypothetical protein